MPNTEQGGCYCGNVSVEVVLSVPLPRFTPRACDCDFCVKHGAAYISDPEGRLILRLRNPDQVNAFTQGSGTAQFVICGVCGVLVGATCASGSNVLGTLNTRALANRRDLGAPQPASPRLLSKSEKLSRWEQIWFRDVVIENSDA